MGESLSMTKVLARAQCLHALDQADPATMVYLERTINSNQVHKLRDRTMDIFTTKETSCQISRGPNQWQCILLAGCKMGRFPIRTDWLMWLTHALHSFYSFAMSLGCICTHFCVWFWMSAVACTIQLHLLFENTRRFQENVLTLFCYLER